MTEIKAQDVQVGMTVTKENLGIDHQTVTAVNHGVKGYTGRKGTELVFTDGTSVVVYQNKLIIN